jgi:hypothetical protein
MKGAAGIVTKRPRKCGNNSRKAFSRFSTKSSCIRDITSNKESSTI